MKRRKSADPQATRYRIAVTALAKAQRRKIAAEKSIAELTKKVRAFERRMPAEKLSGIAEADAAKWAEERMRKEKWKEAEKALDATLKVSGDPHIGASASKEILMSKGKVKRRLGIAVRLREGLCIVWDFRDGFKTGRWVDRYDRKKLRPLDETRDASVVQYMPASTFLPGVSE